MLRSLILAVALVSIGAAAPAFAAGEAVHPHEEDWEFNGIFGTFDRASAQRGLQVYREVCHSCHALDYVAFRNLEELGFTEDEVKAIAAEYQVPGEPDDFGEVNDRPAIASDLMPAPFANEKAARANNGGAYPPNLSLITKAREGGPDYLYSLLTGYQDPPEGEDGPANMHYNPYFAGHWIAMPAPLFEDGISYSDETPATVEQMAHDVTNFLMWTAEPQMEARKQTGIKVVLFLIVLTVLLYFVKRKVWSDVEH
ncbi:cytochrome c1 [Marinivivus vitaminiproducens]|uniref:cytochrome c1 n=1 Tax=Marinivivus vitaminiproducens TaxID=3035935 RepID=UPI0027992A04|nr:cytochrome c1 [Geminicoccaceae bacterium SCSIO 64248]